MDTLDKSIHDETSSIPSITSLANYLSEVLTASGFDKKYCEWLDAFFSEKINGYLLYCLFKLYKLSSGQNIPAHIKTRILRMCDHLSAKKKLEKKTARKIDEALKAVPDPYGQGDEVSVQKILDRIDELSK
jgi:hypothetical protein